LEAGRFAFKNRTFSCFSVEKEKDRSS